MNKQEKEKFIEKILSWGSWCNEVYTGEIDRYVKISKVRELIKCVNEPQKVKARLAKHWDEDLGDCLWWNFPVEEPPYCGTPLDDDFPKYKTHFTELHIPDEVEEEPKYYVELPFEEWDEDAAELKTGLMYLAFDITSDETRITTNKNGYRDFKTKLDEETIKSIDERFWPFAVPVEKV